MPNTNQFRYDDPDRPWKWMSNGTGGYRMYFEGKEVTADDLEYFLNNNHYNLGILLDYIEKQLLKQLKRKPHEIRSSNRKTTKRNRTSSRNTK